jgi:hypothetical protein
MTQQEVEAAGTSSNLQWFLSPRGKPWRGPDGCYTCRVFVSQLRITEMWHSTAFIGERKKFLFVREGRSVLSSFMTIGPIHNLEKMTPSEEQSVPFNSTYQEDMKIASDLQRTLSLNKNYCMSLNHRPNFQINFYYFLPLLSLWLIILYSSGKMSKSISLKSNDGSHLGSMVETKSK